MQLQVEWDWTCDLIWNLKLNLLCSYVVVGAGLRPKAMTVFCNGSFWRFKPFNGSFHLKALVGVFGLCRGCGLRAVFFPELMNSRPRRPAPAISSHVLCCDWTLMKHYVLPHCVFTCHSRHLSPKKQTWGLKEKKKQKNTIIRFWGIKTVSLCNSKDTVNVCVHEMRSSDWISRPCIWVQPHRAQN